MWTPRMHQAVFVEEEKYVWAESKSKLFRRLLTVSSIAVMAVVIFSTLV